MSLCFYSNFEWESSLDARLNSASNEYPLCILLTDPATPKIEIPKKTWWWHHHHFFSGISYFWGSEVCQKYAVWVLVVCGIKFRIKRALPLEIWVKTQGDMSKIRTKNVVFLWYLSPKFILKNCLRPIRYFKFKAISLANTWWHGIWIKVKRPILSWNFL